jgi:hypothetical protein
MRTPGPVFLLSAAATLACAMAAGCNIVAPAYYFIHGPEKTKKLVALDEKKTTVIFIDDRQNRIPRRALRIAIGQEAEKAMLKEKVVKDMVSAESALNAAGGDNHGHPAPVSEVGAAVKADVVIYATVDVFTLTQDGQSFAPLVRLRVKVIDVAADKRLWPAEDTGYPMEVRPLLSARELPTSLAARFQMEDEMARQTGAELAQIFYTHETAKGFRTPE